MTVGTKSLLWGVHQAVLHPIAVARAWRFLHGRWPDLPVWICIVTHDWGYWSTKNMDGEEGRRHPERGAKLAGRLCYHLARWRGHAPEDAMFFDSYYHNFTLFHSRHYAAMSNHPVSDLFLADKLCVMFEPRWLYLLRATLSGEIHEYMANAGDRVPEPKTKWTWHRWYQQEVLLMLCEKKLSMWPAPIVLKRNGA